MNGWIKIHRRILKWEWYRNDNTFRVFMHLLLTANYEESKFEGEVIPRGATITGRKALAETLGISEQNVRTALSHLKSTNEITIKVTSRYSVVTLVKYEDYQIDDDEVTNKVTNKVTNDQPATNQRLTTSKEYKNIRSKEERSTNVLPKKENGINFWLSEIESNKDKEGVDRYSALLTYLQKKKAEHLFALRDQLSFDEFCSCMEYFRENGLRMHDIIDDMVNAPGHFPVNGKSKKLSFNLTLRSWARIRLNGKKDNNTAAVIARG